MNSHIPNISNQTSSEIQSVQMLETEPVAYEFTGRHLLASYIGCNLSALKNHQGLLQALKDAVEAAGATVLKTADYVFPQDGLTAVLLLSESHASIHTYPEHAACFVDLFTCGDTCNPEKFDAVMREYLKPREAHRRVLLRDATLGEELVTESCCHDERTSVALSK